MFMLNSNEPIKTAHLQKLADQSMLNGAFVIEMIHSSFSGKLLSFDKVRNVLIEEKVDTWAVKSIFPLDFTKILTYTDVQKNIEVVNV